MTKTNRQVVILTDGTTDLKLILDGHKHDEEVIIAIPLKYEAKINELSFSDNAIQDVIYLDDNISVPHHKNKIIKMIRKNWPTRFLHIIEDDMIVESSKYFDHVEALMDKLSLPYWFNSFSNPMNMVLSKNSPRFIMNLGKHAFDGIDKILFNAHESNEHMVFDLDRLSDDAPFNEKLNLLYNIDMIYRLHKLYPKAYHLNFYPTIETEMTDLARDNMLFPYKNPEEKEYNMEEEEKEIAEVSKNWQPHKILNDLIYWVDGCLQGGSK